MSRTLEVIAEPVPEGSFGIGLRADAITFDREDGVTGSLVHNFGLGGSELMLIVQKDNVKVREVLHVAGLLTDWANAIAKEHAW